MLSGIRIKNFKCLKDTGDIAVKPLTIFVGPNSAGKSSIFQPLLLLKQTAEGVSTPLLIKGQYTKDFDLGAYTDFVYKHDKENKISFEVVYKTTPKLEREKHIKVAIEFGYNEDGIYFNEYIAEDLCSGRNILNAKRQREEYIIKSDFFSSEYKIESREFRKNINIYIIPLIYRQLLASLRDEIRRVKENARGLDKLISAMDNSQLQETLSLFDNLTRGSDELLKQIFYIGPLRSFPKRLYLATGETHQDVGTRGEYSIDVLYSDREKKSVIKKVREWFEKFNIGLETDLEQIYPESSLYNLVFKDPHTKIKVNIADVGFGASQILPIIIEGFCTPKDATIIIEQPEIHLHPKAQAILGDLLIDIAIESKKHLLIETHSEHLISRMQRRVAEGKLKNSDIAIYWCNPSKEGTKIEELKLDSLGQRENWPEGFLMKALKRLWHTWTY